MSKHTPGPWSVDLQKVGKNGRTPINASNWWALAKVVVRMDGDKKNTPVGEANARLIAAAPDLLAALKAVEMARLSDTEADWLLATKLTDKALAKAEGR